MIAITIKALIVFVAARCRGGRRGPFFYANQDGSKTGQVLGIVIPILAILSAVYFAF